MRRIVGAVLIAKGALDVWHDGHAVENVPRQLAVGVCLIVPGLIASAGHVRKLHAQQRRARPAAAVPEGFDIPLRITSVAHGTRRIMTAAVIMTPAPLFVLIAP